jgi:cobalt/nickel transport system permease protein
VHIPDGFINGATSAGAAVAAAGGLGAALRQAGRFLHDKRIPLTGLVAAFIFALQMLNFPVASGTSGHLLGGALAVILVGPWLGITAVSVVVIVQALLFADGGISALGLNVLNMAVITGIVGWLVFRGLVRVLPNTWSTVAVATFAAGLLSVVASALGFVVEYSLGGAGDADRGAVFAAMVGVHFLIGIGEGLISGAVVGLVGATRPDLVAGTAGMDLTGRAGRLSRAGTGGIVAIGLAVAALLVFVVAPLADEDPDGLERVAIDQGFADSATDSGTVDSPLADYGVAGIEDEATATGVSGLIGVGVTFAVGLGIVGGFAALRRRTRAGDRAKAPAT